VRVEPLGGSRGVDAEPRWRELEAAVPDHPLATSWAWTRLWIRHYGDAVAHRLVAVHDGARLAGVALVTRPEQRLPGGARLRRVHLGTAGEPPPDHLWVERNGLLARPGDRTPVAAALAAWVRRRVRHDELVLDGFLPDHAAALVAAEPGLRVERERCPTTDLAAARTGPAGGDVVALLRAGVRRRVRQTLRAYGDLRTEWAQEPDHAERVLDELITLHQARWRSQGLPGAFAGPRARAFHRDAVRELVPRGAAIAFRVRTARGTTVGCVLAYVEGDRVLFHQSGLAGSSRSAERPGLATHVLCMQACSERGLATYDFLAGESRYKHELATGAEELVWARLPRRTPLGVALTVRRAARVRLGRAGDDGG
jgi:CelD/BcsL family acetyltransferase involved in cellulose biosynthesis